MSPRNRLLLTIAILFLVLGVALFTYLTREQESLQSFSATVERDCAPWDGPAFTISIPHEEAVIKVSIYQSPEIRFPASYSFPNESMREGHALLLLPAGVPEPLSGKVSFQPVKPGRTIEGRFDLASGTGQRFHGAFVAEWGNEIVYCG